VTHRCAVRIRRVQSSAAATPITRLESRPVGGPKSHVSDQRPNDEGDHR
jgi:hypothetical protein